MLFHQDLPNLYLRSPCFAFCAQFTFAPISCARCLNGRHGSCAVEHPETNQETMAYNLHMFCLLVEKAFRVVTC